MSRVNPFEDLAEFEAKPKAQPKPVDPAMIDRVAQDNNFPSRLAPKPGAEPGELETSTPRKSRRRYTTGRNKQINIKATDQTIERFYRLADQQHVPLGELLDRALEAFERSVAPVSR
jgi:hypothetical protein